MVHAADTGNGVMQARSDAGAKYGCQDEAFVIANMELALHDVKAPF